MTSLDEFHNKKPVNIWPITLLRIYTGVFFLKFGWGKITIPISQTASRASSRATSKSHLASCVRSWSPSCFRTRVFLP